MNFCVWRIEKNPKLWIIHVCHISNRLYFIVSLPVNETFVWAIFGDYKSPWNPVGCVRKCHHLTGKRQPKICIQNVWAEISVVVISTDPSEAVWNRCGQVVLEGCYQLFINNTLSSSCGQLKDKHFLRKCIIFLWYSVNYKYVRNGDTFEFFLFELECRLILTRPNLLIVRE